MSDTAIKVENLSKRYRIGMEEEMHDTFAGAITHYLKQPIRNLRRLRRLTTFEDGHKTQDVTRNAQHATRNTTTNDHEDIIWALRDVSFEVERGEVVGIIGRNGAGKSTLLKILSRITEPTSGRVVLNGRVSSLLEVGTGFHPELTGRENIYLNGAILGMKKAEIERKFDEIVDFSGVEKFIDTPVKRYSSGMQVRLAFSVAAHLEPEILLVDEVLAVGDTEFQKKCLGKMGAVAQEGRTVLFVSHNMSAIKNLCERCILLNNGRIILDGLPEQVIPDYLSQGKQTSGFAEVYAGNPDVAIIREIGIINAAGDFASSVEADKEFLVWIHCVLKRKLEQSQIAVAIQSVADGAFAFVTTHVDGRPTDDLTLLPGEYRAKVRIPGKFLNIGTYTVNVRIFGRLEGDSRTTHAAAFRAVTFTVEETGSLYSNLPDRRGGLVTPLLEWKFE